MQADAHRLNSGLYNSRMKLDFVCRSPEEHRLSI